MEKSFETEVLTRLAKIETKLDDYSNTRNKVDTAYTQSNENKKDIQELQDKIKWISRTSIGAIITGLIGLLFAFIKLNIK
jgi:hypothetical protein